MPKLRRYKRDSDGRFARVNSLAGGVTISAKASATRSEKARRSDKTKRVGKVEAAAGKMSLAQQMLRDHSRSTSPHPSADVREAIVYGEDGKPDLQANSLSALKKMRQDLHAKRKNGTATRDDLAELVRVQAELKIRGQNMRSGKGGGPTAANGSPPKTPEPKTPVRQPRVPKPKARVAIGDRVGIGNGTQVWIVKRIEGDNAVVQASGDFVPSSGRIPTRKVPLSKLNALPSKTPKPTPKPKDPESSLTKGGLPQQLRDEAAKLSAQADRAEVTADQLEKAGNPTRAAEFREKAKSLRSRADGLNERADKMIRNQSDRAVEELRSKPLPNPGAAGGKDEIANITKGSEIRLAMRRVTARLDQASEELNRISDPDERDKFRKSPGGPLDIMMEMIAISDRQSKIQPDLSRQVSEAANLEQLTDIMADRHPNLNMNGWDELGGALSKARSDYNISYATVLERAKRAFQAADDMAIRYPEVPWSGFHCQPSSKFDAANVIAHCTRGRALTIEFNANFLTVRTPAGSSKNADLFHPPNFEKDPHYNTVVHEFGHSMDWFAFDFHDLYNSNYATDARAAGDQRDYKDIWKSKLNEVMLLRDDNMKRRIAERWVTSSEKGEDFYDWFRANTSGYAKHNDDELIAESWQDYHTNGESASPVSKAVVEFVLENYRNRIKRGVKTQWL